MAKTFTDKPVKVPEANLNTKRGQAKQLPPTPACPIRQKKQLGGVS